MRRRRRQRIVEENQRPSNHKWSLISQVIGRWKLRVPFLRLTGSQPGWAAGLLEGKWWPLGLSKFSRADVLAVHLMTPSALKQEVTSLPMGTLSLERFFSSSMWNSCFWFLQLFSIYDISGNCSSLDIRLAMRSRQGALSHETGLMDHFGASTVPPVF